MTEIKRRRIATNGIELSILEAGEGPLVLLVHGFPESAYSWRHQLPALAAAGYHAVAPDMRGYGESDLPADITAYNQWDVSHDILGLVSALGYEQAVVIGHDWGAPTAWNCALLDPQTVRAVGALSVPFSPRGTEPPLGMLKRVFEGQFFYQLYFQTPGVAEAEFEAPDAVDRACTTSPRAVSDLLMCRASARVAPVDLLFETRSEPARSTR